MRQKPIVFACYFFVASCLAILTSPPTIAKNVNGNAALVYWQAYDGLPEVSAEEYRKAMVMPVDRSLDEKIVERCEGASHALLLLHRASTRTYCDWGIDFSEDGAEAILPHLAPARGLARLALLRARQRFFEGSESEAISDVLAVIALARHAGRDRRHDQPGRRDATHFHDAVDETQRFLKRTSNQLFDIFGRGPFMLGTHGQRRI